MDAIVVAVQELRSQLGESREAFATRLGLSISVIAKCEGGRRPQGASLVALADEAQKANRWDLAAQFAYALFLELKLAEHNISFVVAPSERPLSETNSPSTGLLVQPLANQDEARFARVIHAMFMDLRGSDRGKRKQAFAILSDFAKKVETEAGANRVHPPGWQNTETRPS